jgi:4-amino-4-deoxy-L-arabinose transferase-like glycosyltransferase
MRSSRTTLFVVVLLAVAGLTRGGFVVATPHYKPQTDSRDYLRLGRAVAHTGAYPRRQVWVTQRGCPPVAELPRTPCVARPGAPGAHLVSQGDAYRPPGYPYALALPALVSRWIGHELTLARLFQVLIGVIVVGLVGLLGWMLWGRRVGLIALGLSAVYIPLVLVSGVVISEPLYTAFMLGSICAVLRWRTHGGLLMLALAGALAGLTALTRENGVIVLVGVAALALSGRDAPAGLRRLRAPVLVLVLGVLTIAPWTIRNQVVMHGFLPISDESGPTLVGTWNPISQANRSEPGSWTGHVSRIAPYKEIFIQAPAHSQIALDNIMQHYAITYALDHPAYIGTVFWHNTLRLLELHGVDRIRFGADTIGLPPGAAVDGAIMFYVVAILALAGAFAPATRRVPRALWIIPALQFLTTVIGNAETPRFRTPLEPFILLLAAVSIDYVVELAARRLPRRRLAAAVS